MKLLKDKRGIALFLVLSTLAVLAMLVGEFTYISQVNQRIAYDTADKIKAFYQAKSALKISLVRLKAYQNVIGLTKDKNMGSAVSSAVPKNILEQIWSFPLMFPIPTELPGISGLQKDAITKFNKDSGMEGNFTAVIESESSKYNLNLLLAQYVPKGAAGATGATGGQPANNDDEGDGIDDGDDGIDTPPAAGATGATGAQAFSVEDARASLQEYLRQILAQKTEEDEDFAVEFRDFRLEDLMENIYAWVDGTYESRSSVRERLIAVKKGPFYSVSELHMIQPMDDKLYDLFSPHLTVMPTPGVNVNTLKEPVLRALLPQIQKEEAKDFFEFRDNPAENNAFKAAEDFFTYVEKNIAAYQNSQAMEELKKDLDKRNIRIVTEESQFKITVRSQVQQATRVIEAWVELGSPGQPSGSQPGQPPPSQPGAPPADPNTPVTGGQKADPGLKVIFMRIL